ncbi:MAG TPA: DUF2330 domain-containing protein [Polyangia bacterium]|jgi:hypothetical protein
MVSTARWVAVAAVAGTAIGATPGRAHAFCGFFVAGSDAKLTNNASQVVLMRKGNRTVMTMSNTYQGPPENFAMIVPVPVVLKKGDVKTLPSDVFDRVDSLSAPRLVEYWEQDPCAPQATAYGVGGLGLIGVGSGGGGYGRHKGADLGVKIEARFVAGEYEIVILSARESSGLETWLRQEKYNIPQGAATALAPYVRDKSKFFVAKVNIKKVKRDAQGVVQLSPLRFAFDANELRLPVRLGLLNTGGKQDLIVYVIHPTARFEVANYANTFIPTNLEVADGVRKNFPAFFAELFDATVEKMERKVVVTEYAWQTNGCDPCPTPPLTPQDLSTLGLDILEGAGAAAAPYTSWVLTRLHTRYSKETLSEDLIFREAKPAMGGRANWNGTNGDEGATVSQAAGGGVNNFQGRYIIRHYWTGAVACKEPHYDTWGGPPGDPAGRSPATAAKGLATAPRGKVVLRDEVRSPVPLLGIAGKPAHRRKAAAQ